LQIVSIESSLATPAGTGSGLQQIITVASPLGIAVHDHIIVGKEGHASM
jgi:hypothetical protein